MKSLLIVSLLLVACSSCATPQPVPTPAPTPDPIPAPTVIVDAAPEPENEDASRLPVSARICNHLHTLGCDDATSPAECARVLQHAIDASLVTVPATCLLGAQSKKTARACGLVTCN